MNFPSPISSTHDLVRGRQEVGRLGVLARERAEDELRHRHVGGRVDPVAGDVAEHDREAAVRELEEVVDVAADVHPRRRRVDGADVEPGDLRLLARQQRALHRVRELLLLLVEARVVEGERGLAGDRDAASSVAPSIGRSGSSETSVSVAEDLRLRGERDHRGRRALLQERDAAARATGRARRRCAGRAASACRCGRRSAHRGERLRQREDRPQRLGQPRVARRASPPARARSPPRVRHSQRGGVDVERLDDRARDRLERQVEREALGEEREIS